VVNDAIDYGEIGEESDDPHHAAALRADHRINFIGLRFILHLILFLRWFDLI
jgi:hypothetical protein